MCLFFLLTSPSRGFPGFTRVRLHTFVSGSFRLGFPQPLIFSQSISGLLSPTRDSKVSISQFTSMTVWGKLIRTRLPQIIAPRSSQTWCTLDLFLIRKNLFTSLPWLLIGWVLPSVSSRVCFSSQGRKSSKTLSGCAVQWFTDNRYTPLLSFAVVA